MAKAAAKVVFSLATRNRFWFGMTISVSTFLASSSMPRSAVCMRRCAFEMEGLGHDADGEDACSLRGAGDDRRRTGAGAAAHAGGDEAHMGAGQMIEISASASSAAAAPICGCEPAPRPCVSAVPIWMRRSAALWANAWASVLATTNSTPSRPAFDHVVDGVSARSAHAEDGDPRLEFGEVSAR